MPAHRTGAQRPGKGPPPHGRRLLLRLLLALGLAAGQTGCATVGYYAQAVSGQLAILGRARPVAELLADPAIPPPQKERLRLAEALRAFAVRELLLPDNDSYRAYADLGRPYAVWNVFAAPPFSLRLEQWCFLFVGCLSYRGYFSRERAEAYAQALRAQGYDVYVAGVSAFSTLGWLPDPLLNTMLDKPEPETAALLFHELAHQRLYVRDDSAFSESFAVAVEREGVRRWLTARGGSAQQYARYRQARQRHEQLQRLLLEHRARLEALYASVLGSEEKHAAKRAAFEQIARDYAALKRQWGGYDGFDTWMQDLNNAKLAAVGLYHRHLDAFQALLARCGGELAAFYREAEALARLPKEQREAALAALAASGGAPEQGSRAERERTMEKPDALPLLYTKPSRSFSSYASRPAAVRQGRLGGSDPR